MENISFNKKWYHVNLSLILIFLLFCILPSCNKTEISFFGDYEFEDIIYLGGLSSTTYDYQLTKMSGVKFSIEKDSLKITDKNNEELYVGISYKKEKIDSSFIKKNYNINDPKIIAFFHKYTKKYRYSLINEQGEKIFYYLFLMDGDLFICKYAKEDTLMFFIYKLKCISN